MLECRTSVSGHHIISAFSFHLGRPVSQAKDGDLFFYFDRDDCEGGALVGRYDAQGWLFSIGHQSWQKLQGYQHPPALGDSVEVITPITKAHEGFTFWLKTVSGRYAVIRIVRVLPATFDEIARGKTATIEFEWMWR